MNNRKQPDGFFDRIWNFFTSVKLSISLLLTLAVTSIIGTLLPQNLDPLLYRQKFGPVIYPMIEAFNLADMYHSWWFRLLIVLLMVNIVVCSIERLTSTWKLVFPLKPVFPEERFRKSPYRADWEAAKPVETLKTEFSAYMEKHYRHTRIEPSDEGYVIFGEKGRWTRLGVYIVHLSILLLMIGGLIGSIFGFEGTMNLPVGQTDNKIALRNEDQARQLDFEIRCDDFTVTQYPSGMPKEYRSELAIVENGKVVFEKDLRVNDPIRHRGINIFQSSYGRVPGDTFTVAFTENVSGLRVEKRAAIGDKLELPAGGGTLIIEDYSDNFGFRGHSLGPTFISQLIPKTGMAQPVVLPVEYPSFDRMRGGDYTISIENIEYRYYTGLQITRDPGVPMVYAGFAAMIIGCYITFFMFHRQIRIKLAPAGDGTAVTVTGVSPKNRPVMSGSVKKLARKLENLPKGRNTES